MSANRKIIPPEVLLESYQRNAGNITATAKDLGADRQTIRKCLALYGADKKPVTGGSVKPLKHNVMPLPEKGKVKRYLLSCAQSNTKAFTAFIKNLEAYREWLVKRSESCEIMISRFTYNKSAFQNSKSKPGKQATLETDVWFDPSIEPYVCDDPERHGTCRWQLAPDLYWCSELQIEPTAVRPLSGLHTYGSGNSCIFPHVKISMEPVPRMPDKEPVHVYTTGTVTGRNYIQRKAGLKAEFHHQTGAIIAEVDSSGLWWVRQLNADSSGAFYDILEGEVIKANQGEVTTGNRLEALNYGDVHAEEIPTERIEYYWAPGGILDQLKPKYQFCHDLQSFRARNHHEMKSFAKNYEKYIQGIDSVENELSGTADLLNKMEREWSTTVVVPSNHDRFPERWLDEANFKNDYLNAEFYLEAQLERVRAIKRGESGWIFLDWALKRAGCPETVRFIRLDESFVICQRVNHPIECGLHADLGPNGARGSVGNLSNLGMKANFGHIHSAYIREGNMWAGTMALWQGYNFGPSTWSVSHIATMPSGKRQMLSERGGKLWATRS